ncbi:MAG TPA: DUF3047 domain-containing protein [Methylomirabilota bacterium]
MTLSVPTRIVAVLVACASLLAPPLPVPRAAEGECRVIDDFSAGPIGALPSGWRVRKDSAKGVYRVTEEDGRRFLHAASRRMGIQAGKEYKWNLKEYPMLAWSWRPVEFPRGADERQSRRNDSALAVYAVFPYSPIAGKALKYIWSEHVPPGTHLESNRGLTQVIVLRAGAAHGKQWVDERVNVLEDYRKYFGDGDAQPAGIGVLTDSDDTRSSAQGDYANFRVCR